MTASSALRCVKSSAGREREGGRPNFLRREGGLSMRGEEVRGGRGEEGGRERRPVSGDFLDCKCVGWESRRKSEENSLSSFH